MLDLTPTLAYTLAKQLFGFTSHVNVQHFPPWFVPKVHFSRRFQLHRTPSGSFTIRGLKPNSRPQLHNFIRETGASGSRLLVLGQGGQRQRAAQLLPPLRRDGLLAAEALRAHHVGPLLRLEHLLRVIFNKRGQRSSPKLLSPRAVGDDGVHVTVFRQRWVNISVQRGNSF